MESKRRETWSLWAGPRKTFFCFFLGLILLASGLISPDSGQAFDRRTPVVEAIAKAGPAVVNIRTEQVVRRRSSPFFGFGDSFFDEFFGRLAPPRVYKTQSLGSGVIIDPSGYLVTNAHVVEKASKIFVALLGELEEYEAELVGIDVQTDLAVIRLPDKAGLPSVTMGRSDDLILGETVIAIGNPLGLENSVTTGVVSAPGRRMPDGEGSLAVFIQTDALINPGNSGGPLININGELIGINTAIAQQAQGIGFAVPVNVVKRITQDLIQHGRVRPVYTGILPGEISRTMVKLRGSGGALVTEIDPGSPAQLAGLQVADVILAVDGVRTDSAGEFLALLRTYPPGTRLDLHVLRGVEERHVNLRTEDLPVGYVFNYARRLFGWDVTEGRQGVLVSDVIPGSPAAGIEALPGDLIAEVEGVRVESLEDYRQALEQHLGRLPLRFTVVRGGRGYLVEMP